MLGELAMEDSGYMVGDDLTNGDRDADTHGVELGASVLNRCG